MPHRALSTAALLDGIGTSDAGVARLFERVRDIPFSLAPYRDADTLLTCGSGTGAPKRARLWAELELETRFVSVTFRFDDTVTAGPPP